MQLFHCLSVGVCALALVAPAECAEPPKWSATFRYRMEQVERADFARQALAATARLRLGADLPIHSHWHLFAQAEAVLPLNDRFNSGANGQLNYPAIADASAVEWDQLGLAWRSNSANAIIGRQQISFDNQRFIGNVGWRQNEQTFDSTLLAITPNAFLSLHYGWLDRVHRVAGDRAIERLARERNLDSHLVHATLNTRGGPLAMYFYGLKDQDVAAASSQSWGIRWTPSTATEGWHWGASMEAAQQRQYGNNPSRFRHGYHLLEASTGVESWNLRLGWERLAGNGEHAFQTPLATLHAFNGWADVFASTPKTGLNDRYLSVNGACPFSQCAGIDWTLAWHRFDPTGAGASYGREWNAAVSRKLGHGWSVLLKFADYRAQALGPDTRKLWLQLEWTK